MLISTLWQVICLAHVPVQQFTARLCETSYSKTFIRHNIENNYGVD